MYATFLLQIWSIKTLGNPSKNVWMFILNQYLTLFIVFKRFCNTGYKSNTLCSMHAKKLNGNFDTKPVCQLHVKVFIKMPFKSCLRWEPWTWALTGYLEMELHNKQKHNGFLELALQFSVPLLLHKFKQLLNNKVHHIAVHLDISSLSLSNVRKAFSRPVFVCVCSVDETACQCLPLPHHPPLQWVCWAVSL